MHSISIINGVIVTERDEIKQWTPTKVAKPNSDGYYLVTVNDNVTVLKYNVAQGFVPGLFFKFHYGKIHIPSLIILQLSYFVIPFFVYMLIFHPYLNHN